MKWLHLNSQWWPQHQILTASLRPASSSPYEGQPGPPYWLPLLGGISTGWAPILLAMPTCVRCWIWEPEGRKENSLVNTGWKMKLRSKALWLWSPHPLRDRDTRPWASWFTGFYFLLIQWLISTVLFPWLDTKELDIKGINRQPFHSFL